MRRLLLKVVVLVVPLFVLLLVRHGRPDMPRADERAAFGVFDPEIGWLGRADYHGWYTGAVRFEVRQNNLGMRDHDLGAKTRPRLLVLGDSYVWGYDSEQDSMFTAVLGRRHPEIEVVNAGVSGYGTDQEYLLLRRYFDRIRPDAVVVVFSNTDNLDNASRIMAGYNKPYFVEDGGRLVLRGVPVEKSLNFWALEHAGLFRRPVLAWIIASVADLIRPYPIVGKPTTLAIVGEMRRYLAARGVPLGFMFETGDPALQTLLAKEGVPWVSVEDAERGDSHWTARGNVQVADLLEPLMRSLLRDGAASRGARSGF